MEPIVGKVALVAKITHVPSLYLSELDGPRQGSRQAAIDGLKEIGRRCRDLGDSGTTRNWATLQKIDALLRTPA